MLELTDRATEAIRIIVSATETGTGGVRIYARPLDDESAAIDLAVVAEAEPNDAVLGEEDARVFLEAGAAALLDDKVLDAKVDGSQVSFSVEDQNTETDFSSNGKPPS